MGEPIYRLEGIVHTRRELMEDFEGPLDVIFLLLSKNKIEIQNVSITAILEQYLAYLEEMKRLDIELASEFITMASHLMLIKTKMLLSTAEAIEAETELDLLRQSLIERQRHEAMDQIRMHAIFPYRSTPSAFSLFILFLHLIHAIHKLAFANLFHVGRPPYKINKTLHVP